QVQRLPRHLLTPTLKYWLHYKAVVAVRDVNGALAAKPIDWRRAYMRVGEVEAFVRKHLPTKLPDRDPARLGDGTLVYPHELLFLMPIRA
ncbi:hypothetical protein, partial [Klebsiella pneumoniae]|uniref:hypothetical protein n=1 Tax=Klebsiella pneumoniae TaxID=573 RepID=UPI001953B414